MLLMVKRWNFIRRIIFKNGIGTVIQISTHNANTDEIIFPYTLFFIKDF